MLVTAYGYSSDYCNSAGWGSNVMYVACYQQGGTPVSSDFDVTFQTW